MKLVTDRQQLREQLAAWRRAGEGIALVPTMGNLHAGHLRLVEVASENARRVVVSLFVNPTQFGAGEDFDSYPRTFQDDRDKLEAAPADLLFAPDLAAVYPFGIENATRVIVPGLGEDLCGAARPGHFDGVTSVVARLFALVQPDVAVFGQKDYQQQLVIRRMVDDLGLPLKIITAPTVREQDGLAMSSRNAYLDDEQRQRAPALYQALLAIERSLRAGDDDFAQLERSAGETLAAAGFEVDYVSIRRADDLAPPQQGCRNLVVLAAAVLGAARLIDNIEVGL